MPKITGVFGFPLTKPQLLMSQGNQDKLKLMVVDDESDNLDLLYRTFRRKFQVFRANDAITALDILDTEGEMAIIISDQRLGGMNGTEFLSRTVERFPDTIRILLTAYTDIEDLVEAINSGQVYKYITKPWQGEELKAVVRQAAETYQVLKKRTRELSRALRREELFNMVTTAIRESLDYSNLLQKVVTTMGQAFDATACILQPVEFNQLTPECFTYKVSGDGNTPHIPNADLMIQQVLEKPETKLWQETRDGQNSVHLIVPLPDQQQILGVLCLYQQKSEGSWNTDDIQLIEAVAKQAALAISQAKLLQRTQLQAQQMRDELDVARQIQNNLLRQSWPKMEQVRVQAHCTPARQVGGDFFEVYVHPQGDIWLAVGDVSGKGVPAALFMTSAMSMLRRELAQETSPDPKTVIQNLNHTMSDDLYNTNRFITLVLARYTPEKQQLVYANAGHTYPMVWSDHQVVQQHSESKTPEPTYLEVRGIPLGILPIWQAESGHLRLNSGSILLLTSDGITEATLNPLTGSSSNGSTSTSSRLESSGLWQLLLQQPAPFDLSHLLARIRERTNPIQEDDQTLVSLEIL